MILTWSRFATCVSLLLISLREKTSPQINFPRQKVQCRKQLLISTFEEGQNGNRLFCINANNVKERIKGYVVTSKMYQVDVIYGFWYGKIPKNLSRLPFKFRYQNLLCSFGLYSRGSKHCFDFVGAALETLLCEGLRESKRLKAVLRPSTASEFGG